MGAQNKSLALVELEITRLLEEASSVESVAEDILRTLCRELSWDLAELWLLDADADLISRTAVWYQPDFDSSMFDTPSRGVAVTRGYGLSGRVVATGDVTWVTDLRLDPAIVRKRAAARAGLRCAVCFPLVDSGEITGAVTLFRRQAAEPHDQTTAALKAIGRKMGEFARTDLALRRGGAHFRAIVENQADIVGLIGLDGVIHYENAAVTQVLGYDRRERLGRNVYEFIHPSDVPAARDTFRKALDDPGSLQVLTTRVRHKDGSWRLLESTGRVMVDSSGKHVALANTRDISNRAGRRRAAEDAPPVTAEPAPLPALTDREIKTLRLVARGMSNKQIAAANGISPYTVKDHLQAAMRKLGTRSRVEAAAIATRRGII
jgi:PAS domain S-box-containing protein